MQNNIPLENLRSFLESEGMEVGATMRPGTKDFEKAFAQGKKSYDKDALDMAKMLKDKNEQLKNRTKKISDKNCNSFVGCVSSDEE